MDVPGEGKWLFETGMDRSMLLSGPRTTGSGLAASAYRPAGGPALGSVDDPRNP